MQALPSRPLVYRGFRLFFDEPGLNDGVHAFTLQPKTRIMDVIVSCPDDWTGTNPTMDLFIDDATTGLLNNYMGDPASLGSGDSRNNATRSVHACLDSWAYNVAETVWSRDDVSSLFVCVSQDGTRGGDPVGGGQGELLVMLGTVVVPQT